MMVDSFFRFSAMIAAVIHASTRWLVAADLPPEPLVIQQKGSFVVVGTVVTAPGKFDPSKQGAFNPASQDPAGQTKSGKATLSAFRRT